MSMRAPAPCKVPASIGLICTAAWAAPSLEKFIAIKKYPNFMSAPFSGLGCVRTPLSIDWGARLCWHLMALIHASSVFFLSFFETVTDRNAQCHLLQTPN
jgi:hypothetical protein